MAVDDVEAGRLAGAVGSDQRHPFSRADGKRNVVQRLNAVERLGDVFDAQQRGVPVIHCRRARSNRRAAAPPTPMGKASTSSRMIAPNTLRQYSVWRGRTSCSQVKAAAPINGPASALTPPS